MVKRSSASKIKLNQFQDLFGMNESMTEAEDLRYIPLSELHTFRNHPFQVRWDARMEELIASIKENGVLVPGVARIRPQGGYEIIAGHSRKFACEQAGLSEMPMFIRNVSDDDAIVMMVDSNIQREDILPSEKAWAYKMKYDAIKHQGKKGNSLKLLEESSGDKGKTIQRYIWLTNLIENLLHMVDRGRIGFVVGVRLSELKKDDQQILDKYLTENEKQKISVKQAGDIVKAGKKANLTEEILKDILRKEVKQQQRMLTLSLERMSEFFPENVSEAQMEEVILNLLEEWKKRGGAE